MSIHRHMVVPIGIIFGVCWGYVGIMENKMETSIYDRNWQGKSQHSRRGHGQSFLSGFNDSSPVSPLPGPKLHCPQTDGLLRHISDATKAIIVIIVIIILVIISY